MKKDFKSDSKDLQIMLYSIVFISGFTYLELGDFKDSSYVSSPQILVLLLVASVRINGSCEVFEGHWREFPSLLIFQFLLSLYDGVQQEVNILTKKKVFLKVSSNQQR
jgi:hypothetical protein